MPDGPDSGLAARVTFGYYSDSGKLLEKHTFSFWVPKDLLWSVEGLAELFNLCRDLTLGEHRPGASGNDTEWGSWHIVDVSTENNDHVIIDYVFQHAR